MRHTLTLLAGSILSLVASVQASAICSSSLSLDQAREKSQSFVQNMKVAKARGDIKSMNHAYQSFYPNFLEQCSDVETAKICGFDCQLQIGEFHLFMASEVSYYYSKSVLNSDIPVVNPEDMQVWVNDGVNIIEKAKSTLITDTKEGDITDYFSKGAKLNALLAKLYMASGDNWYQTMSETRIERLKYIVANATDTEAPTDITNEARAMYKKASWVLQSAIMEVPDQSAFASIHADFSALNHDLENRLRSLDEGLLFLDIDPEEFTNISTKKLRDEIELLSNQIGVVEQKVENMIKEWNALSLNHSVDQINEYRRSNEISISQSSYRLAKLEGLAQTYSNQISADLEKIQQQSNAFQYQMDRYNYQFGLKIKLQEMQDRQALLLKRKEIDVLAFEQNSAERRLNDLRWLMSWEIAKNNIQLQLSQFDSQIEQYNSEANRKTAALQKIQTQYASNEERINISKFNQEDAISTMQQLKLERDQINSEHLASLEAQLCGVVNRLNYLDEEGAPDQYTFVNNCNSVNFNYNQSSYQNAMCGSNGLRQQLAAQQISTVEHALCTVGTEHLPTHMVDQLNLNCSGTSQIAMATDIFEKEMQLADLKISNAEAQRKRLSDQIKQVRNNFKKDSMAKAALEASTLALAAVYGASTAIPKTSACACGLASGVATLFDAEASAKAAWATAQSALALGVDWMQYVSEHNEEVTVLRNHLKSLDEALEAEQFAKGIQNMHANKAIAEMTGSALDYSNQMLALLIQEDMTLVDCDQQTASLQEQVASSLSTYDYLTAEIRALDYQRDHINLAIDRQQSAWNQNQANIAILTNANKELDIEVNTLNEELATVARLIGQTSERKNLVLALNTKLSDLEFEASAESQAIDALAQLKQDQVLALTDEEFAQIDNVILLNQTYTDQLISFVNELESLSQIDSNLKLDVIAFRDEVNGLVAQEREKILNRVQLSLVEANQNVKHQMFMATEEELATLTESLPNFVKAKRGYLEKANKLLVQLRNRVQAMVSLAGGNPLSLANSAGVTYVKTRTDLDKLSNIVKDQYWLQSHQVVTQTTVLPIHAECGLARELASNRKAAFEISPYGLGMSEQNGCYTLWNSSLEPDVNGFMQNLLLLDVNLEVEFSQASCENRRFAVTHTGQGMIFKETSANDSTLAPSLIATASRTLLPTYVTNENYPGSMVERVWDFWSANHYLNNFLETPPPNEPSSSGTVPLLGLPVIGTYQLALGNPSEGCSYDDAAFNLIISYASDPRLAN